MGTSIFKIWNRNYVWKKKNPKWSKFIILKRRKWKEVKEDPNLVANGRFQCLVALGRFKCLVVLEGSNAWWLIESSNAWWPLEGSNVWWHWKVPMLGGLWKAPMFSDLWKEKGKHFFTSSHFPPTIFT